MTRLTGGVRPCWPDRSLWTRTITKWEGQNLKVTQRERRRRILKARQVVVSPHYLSGMIRGQ